MDITKELLLYLIDQLDGQGLVITDSDLLAETLDSDLDGLIEQAQGHGLIEMRSL